MIAIFARVRPLTRLILALSGFALYFAVEIAHFAGAPVGVLLMLGFALALPLAAAVSASRRHL